MTALEKQFLGAAAKLLPWMSETGVTDLLINGVESAYVQRYGALEAIDRPFATPAELFDFLDRILIPLGKRMEAARPYIDGKLADGSRFHLIYPPLAPRGPVLSIRKHARRGEFTWENFGGGEGLAWAVGAFGRRRNLLLCGGTGSGKTTLLTLLLQTVPHNQRLLVIEESPEIRLDHPHAVYLEARPENAEGVGEVTLSTLLRNALRMRPDRLVLGECRGPEAWDLIQALNTGHPGSACTLHANGARDGLRRLETLLLLAQPQAPLAAVREWVASALDGVVFLGRSAGVPRVLEVLELKGLESQNYRIHPHLLQG